MGVKFAFVVLARQRSEGTEDKYLLQFRDIGLFIYQTNIKTFLFEVQNEET